MDHVLPPICDPHRLGAELGRGPFENREDAAQEAWAAHLAGRDPVQAVNTFTHRQSCLPRHNWRVCRNSGKRFTTSKKPVA